MRTFRKPSGLSLPVVVDSWGGLPQVQPSCLQLQPASKVIWYTSWPLGRSTIKPTQASHFRPMSAGDCRGPEAPGAKNSEAKILVAC